MQPAAKQALTRDLHNILSTWMLQKTLDYDVYSCFLEKEAMRLCSFLGGNNSGATKWNQNLKSTVLVCALNYFVKFLCFAVKHEFY